MDTPLPETGTPEEQRLDAEILRLGEELSARIKGQLPSVFDSGYWQGRLLDWAMTDPGFKLDLLRFVDVLPALTTHRQLATHVDEYLARDGRELPTVLSAAIKLASSGITSRIGSVVMKRGVTQLAEQFIIGRDPASALRVIKRMQKDGIAFTVDLLGEATVSDEEARAYQKRYLELIEKLAAEQIRWPADDVIRKNHLGPIPVANVSLKLSAMDSQLDSVDRAGSVGRLKEMVLPIFLLAKEKNVFVNVDLEQWDCHGITYDLFEEILGQAELKSWPHVGIVVQAYLKSAEKDIDRLISLARSRGAPITVRLVKGAYWDYELIRSRQTGCPCPVFTDKPATDANYEKLTARLLENIDYLLPAFGSHNHRSLLNAVALADRQKLPPSAYEIQMLYGMAEPERKAFQEMGKRVRLYAPVGELLPGIGYLVRRLLENTSNQGFLRLSYHDMVDEKALLSRPSPVASKEAGMEAADEVDLTSFENAPLTDFTDDKALAAVMEAIDDTAAALPVKVPVVVGGRKRFGPAVVTISCPSETEKAAAEIAVPTTREADEAVRGAMRAWPDWRDRPVEERAELLKKLARILERDRAAIAALEAFEVAKPIREADGDVAEAIDFCRYYARQALTELAPRKQSSPPGEENTLHYRGRGVALIIGPWNFPAAILCGMTTAALVAGNTVIMKPSGKSSAVGYALYERMMEAGFGSEVCHFIPGAGESVGDYLVNHPLVAQIAFTGSKEVGLSIIEKAAKTVPGQRQVKRVVCEMGGKNAIIVDDDADPDEAVQGIVKSAFGYAGQKCSACSRVIVVGGAVYETFVKRLVKACGSILMAPAHEPGCRLGPVVDEAAYNKLMEVIQMPGEGATPLYIGDTGDAPTGGYYLPPALFEVTDVNHPLMQRELFGPVLAIMRVGSFDQAIEAALSTEYFLTGGVYSRNPGNIEKAKQKFQVGNLYINRSITGALVHRQPFGGFGMSGLGTKAGGPGYLLNFAEPRSISENTMRHGYAPGLE